MNPRSFQRIVRVRFMLLAGLVVGLVTQWISAGEGSPKPRPISSDQRSASQPRVESEEATQRASGVGLFSALSRASAGGLPTGRLYVGQSRYGWDWLAKRYDADSNGAVSRHEFAEPAELFERMDRDHDGEIKAGDFDWSDEAPFVRQTKQAKQWFDRIDRTSDGRISSEEWADFFASVARSKEKEYLTPDDLQNALLASVASSGRNENPPLGELFSGVWKGEIASLHKGPDVGEEAPGFTLNTHDNQQRIRLSDYRGKEPVVLVFGSFT